MSFNDRVTTPAISCPDSGGFMTSTASRWEIDLMWGTIRTTCCCSKAAGLLVLTSGHAEGEENRPDPALRVFDLTDPDSPKLTSTVVFGERGDDPERLVLSQNGTHAAVVLRGTNRVVSLHLSDPRHPEELGSVALASEPYPYLSRSESDAILMPVATDRRVVDLDHAVFAEGVPRPGPLAWGDSGGLVS